MPVSPRRLLLPRSTSLVLVLLSLASAPVVYATTSSYDDSAAYLSYIPSTAWTTSNSSGDVDYYGGGTTYTSTKGAKLTLTFAGSQLSIFGTSSSSFSVAIDGTTTADASSYDPSTSANATVAQRIYLAQDLSTESVHQAVLTSGDGSLLIDRIAIAYSSDTNFIPSLQANGVSTAAKSTATATKAVHTSSYSAIPTSSSSSADSSSDSNQSAGVGSGEVAGIVVAVLGSVALAIFAACIYRRRRNREEDPPVQNEKVGRNRSSYLDQETGQQRSSIFGNLRNVVRNSSYGLSLARTRSRDAQSILGPPLGNHPFGAAAISTRPDSPSAGSWAPRLARAASWRKKIDRLEQTRDFYQVDEAAAVAAVAGPRPPPPSAPLPCRPGEETMMEERWRTQGPSLARGLSEREAHQALQMRYGEAMEKDVDSSNDISNFVAAHGPVSPRRRSVRQEEGSSRRPFSVALDMKDLPLPPPPAAYGMRNSFVNPFSGTPSPIRASFSTFRTGDSDDFNRDSVENAVLRTAHLAPPRTPHPDEVSLYSQVTTAIPIRSNSLRELARGGSLRELARSGSRRGQTSTPQPEDDLDNLVRPALARRPTLTRRDESDRVFSPLSPPPVTGYREEEPTAEEVLSPADKHRSVAGLIETVESFDDELDGVEGKKGARRDPPPGEEDRSAFFARRERMPRYSAGSGKDPRVAGRYGGISRT